MKKILILLLALLMMAAPAMAAHEYAIVIDEAGILEADEVESLNDKAWALSEAYGMEIVIMTTPGLGGAAVREYAADFYDYGGYGYGDNYDGVMLMLSMEERDWYILTTGSATDVFTDYGIQEMGEDMLFFFADGDYAGGFDRFLVDAERYILQAQTGAPFDVGNTEGPLALSNYLDYGDSSMGYVNWKMYALWIVGLALAFTLVGMLILKRGMKSARPQRDADQYVRAGSMNLLRAQDIYLYHTQKRIPRPKQDSSSGGSSTFTSSSGSTHGGGGGKF